jgi:hypothetical protein
MASLTVFFFGEADDAALSPQSLEAVCFFRLLLSFDNASSFLAAHAYSISIGSMKSRPIGIREYSTIGGTTG